MKQYLFRVVSTAETWKRKGEEYIEDELATEVVSECLDPGMEEGWVSQSGPYMIESVSDLCEEIRARGTKRVVIWAPGVTAPEIIQKLPDHDILIACVASRDFHDLQKPNTTICVDVSAYHDIRFVVGDLRPKDVLFIDEEAEWSDRYRKFVEVAGNRVNDCGHMYTWGTVGSQKHGRDLQ